MKYYLSLALMALTSIMISAEFSEKSLKEEIPKMIKLLEVMSKEETDRFIELFVFPKELDKLKKNEEHLSDLKLKLNGLLGKALISAMKESMNGIGNSDEKRSVISYKCTDSNGNINTINYAFYNERWYFIEKPTHTDL